MWCRWWRLLGAIWGCPRGTAVSTFSLGRGAKQVCKSILRVFLCVCILQLISSAMLSNLSARSMNVQCFGFPPSNLVSCASGGGQAWEEGGKKNPAVVDHKQTQTVDGKQCLGSYALQKLQMCGGASGLSTRGAIVGGGGSTNKGCAILAQDTTLSLLNRILCL